MDSDGEEVVRKWMESNYTKPCKLAGMLYMHNLAFDPDDEKLRVSNHLNAFGRACRQNLIPSTIHVVPTLSPEERLSDERLKILAIQLQRQADAEGAQLVDACDGKPFNGNPEMALNIIQGLFSACGADSRPRLIRCETRESPVDDRHACESTKAVSILPKLQANDESAKPCSTSHDGQPFSGKFQTAWDIMLKFLARFKIGTHGHPWLIPRETNHLKKPKG
ncbi:hypothetical protein EDD17DRAFT_797479 [Pisolithus thermaeus]|nr:hypothetical protein EDD17DRAFT_797479 [Pisolithus thermaeus]